MLVASGADFRVRATQLLAAAGATEPDRRGHDLVAYLDGLMYDQLVGAGTRDLGRADLLAACRDLVRAVLY